jgi:hypothetical protein
MLHSTRANDIFEIDFEGLLGAGIDKVDRYIGTPAFIECFVNRPTLSLTFLRIPGRTSMQSVFYPHLPVRIGPSRPDLESL